MVTGQPARLLPVAFLLVATSHHYPGNFAIRRGQVSSSDRLATAQDGTPTFWFVIH